MTSDTRRRWGALRDALGAALDLAVEALFIGVFILVALAVAAFVLWVA